MEDTIDVNDKDSNVPGEYYYNYERATAKFSSVQ